MQHTKPFVKWAGGKTRLLPELRSRLPRTFGRYFEPFIGGGALFFETRPKHAYLSDSNAELMNAFTVVRDHLDALILELEKHVYDKDYYYEIRNADRLHQFESWTNIKKAARLIYLNKTCFNGLYRVNRKGQFNTPFGRYKNPTICDHKALTLCHQALQDAELGCHPFREIANHVNPGDFVYFDPPYAPMSKTANFTGYEAGGFDEEHQEDLKVFCDELTARGVHWMVSNSYTELIQDLYHDYHADVVTAGRAINSKAQERGKINELIIVNYER
jgi:DNA adenine methylase